MMNKFKGDTGGCHALLPAKLKCRSSGQIHCLSNEMPAAADFEMVNQFGP
jgi:hypothetical protein